MRTITAPELARWLGESVDNPPVLLDVREPWEVELASLPGSLAIPMGRIAAEIGSIDPDRSTVCLCHHGARSMQVAMFLERQGFSDVVNLTGGIHAWSELVDPAVKTY
ncbi:MAG TPA: rhodanese-like domain-containing protein [Burkholderiales bacterium]